MKTRIFFQLTKSRKEIDHNTRESVQLAGVASKKIIPFGAVPHTGLQFNRFNFSDELLVVVS